ncbi:MAG: WYL domain-containing protein [Gloeocapsa sp. DLM2.Bin57]|nr:MAG: WYL domain-containing protein [Gloeocapsa sp. DLM2.Bin57]
MHFNMSNKPLICHFLIGIPGSGKSTFAQLLASEIDGVIVSTDEIRAQLYSDAATQGMWRDIEAEVLRKIHNAVKAQKVVIYDATNTMREWRLDFLYKTVHLYNIQWLGWHLDVPVEICQQTNQLPDRQVPDEIIKGMSINLEQFPPGVEEGLLTLYSVPFTAAEFNWEEIKKLLNKSETILKNQANRNSKIIFHKYSYLLDFERLMQLLSVIINYPGIGNLSANEPETLKAILEVEELPEFSSTVAEISAVITKKFHKNYVQVDALKKDLDWLEKNGFLGSGNVAADLVDIESIAYPYLNSHRYKDLNCFQRLMKSIRFILSYPFLCEENGKPSVTTITNFRQTTIVKAMYDYGLFSKHIDLNNDYQRSTLENNFREDICHCLKPYQLLPNFTMKKGYFAGTGILSKYELNQLYQSLQSHSREKYFQDPLAAEIYDTFKKRLVDARILAGEEAYPTRLIGTKSIIKVEKYQQQFEWLEEAIKNGELLEFNYVEGCAKWSEYQPITFRGYPLQIVFHNIAWYLGYEVNNGNKKGLFTFERIDRIRFNKLNIQRTTEEQKKSLKKLDQLYAASAGLYLGNDVNIQTQYLNYRQRKKIELTVILQATEKAFKFICEGNQRFSKIKMSLPDWLRGKAYDQSIFDPRMSQNIAPYQYTIKITLPKWSIFDIDLIRWISAWGKEVKVIYPSDLVEKIYSIGEGITSIYQDIQLLVCELESVDSLVRNKEGHRHRFIVINCSGKNVNPKINPGDICHLMVNNSASLDEQVKKAIEFIKEIKKESTTKNSLQFVIYAHSGISDATEVAYPIYRTLKQDNDLAGLRLFLNYI